MDRTAVRIWSDEAARTILQTANMTHARLYELAVRAVMQKLIDNLPTEGNGSAYEKTKAWVEGLDK